LAGRPLTPILVRTAGAVLLVLSTLPVWRLLDRPETGTIGRSLLLSAEEQVVRLRGSTLVLVVAVTLLTLLVPGDRIRGWLRGVHALLRKSSDRAFALTVAAVAAGLTLILNVVAFQGRPSLLDAGAQLVHARYIAAGRLAGPKAEAMEGGFWYFPNMVFSPEGWVSHFPPGHAFVLAPGLALGIPWLAPVLVIGLTAFLTVILARELFPERTLLARGAALAGALPLLLLLQGATWMNHATAALLGVATLYTALRARGGRWAWALATGAGVTALVALRPLTAVAVCLAVVLLAWLPGFLERARPWPWLAARCGAATVGGLPFLLAHALWNRHFFGGATTFGYLWSFGEAAGLGFGVDPWGNLFGPREALALISVDLATLNLNLLEMPLPVVSLVGLALLLGAAVDWRGRLLAGWVLIPVVLSGLYWHHGYFMGPRMVSEFAPAWGLLTGVSLAFLLSRLPERGDQDTVATTGTSEKEQGSRKAAKRRSHGQSARGPKTTRSGGAAWLPPRRAGELLVVAAALGALGIGTFRVTSFAGGLGESFRMAEPDAPEGSLVLVRGSWISRINADMISHGVPQIVMETALRQNSTCLVHEHRMAFHRGEGAFAPYRDLEGWGERGVPERVARDGFPGDLPPLDLIRRPPPYANLTVGEVGQGSMVWYYPEERLTDACVREIVSEERGGRIDAGFLLWLGDLPGIERGRTMYAREMGPEANARLLERYPDREAYVLLTTSAGAEPVLMPYDQAMAHIWPDPEPE
jgi:hypothetical protein